MIDDQDDQEFDEAMDKTVAAMGVVNKAKADARQDKVMELLEAEMAKLRPHCKRLLYGVKKPDLL